MGATGGRVVLDSTRACRWALTALLCLSVTSRRLPVVLLLAYDAFLLYGSFFPFEFAYASLSRTWVSVLGIISRTVGRSRELRIRVQMTLESYPRPRWIDTVWKVSYNPPAPTMAAEGESR